MSESQNWVPDDFESSSFVGIGETVVVAAVGIPGPANIPNPGDATDGDILSVSSGDLTWVHPAVTDKLYVYHNQVIDFHMNDIMHLGLFAPQFQCKLLSAKFMFVDMTANFYNWEVKLVKHSLIGGFPSAWDMTDVFTQNLGDPATNFWVDGMVSLPRVSDTDILSLDSNYVSYFQIDHNNDDPERRINFFAVTEWEYL